MARAASPAAPLDDADWRQGPSEDWFVNWDKALAEAKRSKKKLFVLSTGSDWCHWCIKLRENVLEKPQFLDFARKNLVLVYLDSPRKTSLPPDQKSHNDEIRERLGFGGGVPSVKILEPDGETEIGTMAGYMGSADAYLKELRETVAGEGK